MKNTNRNKIRIISFASAAIIAAGGLVYTSWNNTMMLKRELGYTYLRSLQQLSSSVSAISSDLSKQMYVGTPQQLNTISSKLWRESGSAKAALTNLPLGQTSLDGTYRFLSQVGDYAMSLSRKALAGQELTDEEQKVVASLLSYSNKLQQHISELEGQFSDGSISIDTFLNKYIKQDKSKNQSGGDEATPTAVDEGLKELETEFSGMPKLIYDGPFSDHLLDRSPTFLKDQKQIPQAEALKKAAIMANVRPENLKFTQIEQSKMPSYCFSGKDLDIGVTVNGGFAAFMTNGRAIETMTITPEQAIAKAQMYLHDLGIKDMETTYYEIANNVCIINFAGMDGNVICYTDLIKVGVAMDNADVVYFDARGYITNHKDRDLPNPKITFKQGTKSLSKSLTPESSRLALIPSPGQNELLCIEYKCKSKNGQIVLVYVNAQTGAEEQILLLIINENGQLAI